MTGRQFKKIYTRTNGFTLIETVLAISLSAALILLILASVRLSFASWDKAEAKIEENSIKRALSARLSREISSIVPYGLGHKKNYPFMGEKDSLTFVTSYAPGSKIPHGGLRLISYSVRDGRFAVEEASSPGIGAGKNVFDFGETVEGISFKYLGSGWEERWNGEEKKAVPRGIEVSIIFSGRNSPFEFTFPIGSAPTEVEGGIID